MIPDYGMDPTDLAGKAEARPRQMTAEESVNEVERISGQLPGIVDRDNPPTTKAFVLEIIKTYGCSRTAAREALNLAVENGILCAGRMEDAPVAFGDLIQVADFDTLADCDGYPLSEAHAELADFSTAMMKKIIVMDYEI